MKGNDDADKQGHDEAGNNVNSSQKVISIIRRYEETIKTQNKRAIGYTGKQGELLKKFKDTENIFDNVGQSRSTIYFKILLYKFLKKYPLLKSYFKNKFKAIKVVCKGNATLFV